MKSIYNSVLSPNIVVHALSFPWPQEQMTLKKLDSAWCYHSDCVQHEWIPHYRAHFSLAVTHYLRLVLIVESSTVSSTQQCAHILYRIKDVTYRVNSQRGFTTIVWILMMIPWHLTAKYCLSYNHSLENLENMENRGYWRILWSMTQLCGWKARV